MRPSIAAALSTLGEVHNASKVLLRPEDAQKLSIRFGDDRSEGRVIVRPDGSLLLVIESGDGPCASFRDDTLLGVNRFAVVGAVEPAAWTWADPKKRQPAPLARVNLDARDIHCLTQGGEIHRGATVGTTTDGRAALQQTYPVIDVAEVVRVAAGKVQAEALRRGAPAATAGRLFGLVLDVAPQIDAALAGPPAATRTPKDGDRLDSLTVAELDGLPVGARFEEDGWPPLVKVSATDWVSSNRSVRSGATVKALCFATRTLVLPKPAEAPKPAASPKVGDRLRDLTPEQRANLPIGTVLAPDEPGKPAMTKGVDGKWHDGIYPTPVETQWLNFDRTIRSFPAPPLAAPKVGDRWGNLTPEQRAVLPVGTSMVRTCAGKDAIATLTPDRRSGSGAVWLVAYDGRTREVDPECLAEDNVILSLPVSK